ncbi:hypothetical protein QC764_204969 [Podospora pseudoanserina]|uniref:Uncharacterized protein n=1 Tax=Podospora pseudoanserina TaxID=2609844 RepID=A0ABR0II82_9PEZI|nr:hypothetical protein QC764_204969 [Podospora pseudoanserina]
MVDGRLQDGEDWKGNGSNHEPVATSEDPVWRREYTAATLTGTGHGQLQISQTNLFMVGRLQPHALRARGGDLFRLDSPSTSRWPCAISAYHHKQRTPLNLGWVTLAWTETEPVRETGIGVDEN